MLPVPLIASHALQNWQNQGFPSHSQVKGCQIHQDQEKEGYLKYVDATETFYSLVFTDKEKAETLKAVPDPRFGIEGAEMNLAHSLELY